MAGCLYTYKNRSFESLESLRSFVKADLEYRDSQKKEFYDFNDMVEDKESYTQSSSFGESIIESASVYKNIPTTLIDSNGEVIDSYNLSELTNTILVGGDNTAFEANKSLLNSLDSDVWNNNQKEIVSVLKDLEKELVKSNIDIIGLYEFSNDRDIVEDVLQKVEDVLNDPSQNNLTNLSAVLQETLPKEVRSYVTEIPKKYENYSIQEVLSGLTQAELFENHGLIKVQDNLYHQVQKEDMSVLYEGVYDKLIHGEISIPKEEFVGIDILDAENKPQVLEAIESYVKGRDVGFETLEKDAVSASQVYYNHTPLEQRRIFDEVLTNSSYLKGEFITDFYNYILEEKLKNSNIYQKTLKNFRVTDGDLSYHGVELDIQGIEMSQELIDYVKIKKDLGKLKELLEEPMYLNEDIDALNSPRHVKANPPTTKIEEGLYTTNLSSDTWVNVDGNGIARLVFQSSAHNLYKQIDVREDGNYYNNNLDFDTNLTQDLKAYNSWVETEAIPSQNDVVVEMEPLTTKDINKYDNCG